MGQALLSTIGPSGTDEETGAQVPRHKYVLEPRFIPESRENQAQALNHQPWERLCGTEAEGVPAGIQTPLPTRYGTWNRLLRLHLILFID